LAHKTVHRDIAKILEEHKVGVHGVRNHRGLLPIQMNHKKLYDDDHFNEVDAEPDYVFVVKKARAAFLVN
jgi:hypothetical protein